ncbi:MAG TPA: DUF6099 family protein, partial [Streptomyces sp.]|uniref:DUF6099 family protein n=1 Tax=Streptomyces sp. TaxID=1931 RepID=UPI002D431DE1
HSLRGSGQRADGARAARLTGIRDPLSALHGLGGLLNEAWGALVRVAVETEEEGLYWRCIEGIDAADECGDRVTEIIRRLAQRSPPVPEARPPGRAGLRDGPGTAEGRLPAMRGECG